MVRTKGFTPLLEAICENDIDRVKEIIAKHPEQLKINSNANESPLHYAMCHGIEHAIPLLLAAGVNPQKLTYSGTSVLNMAIHNGHVNCVQTLLNLVKKTKSDAEYKALINFPNAFGETALHCCVDSMQPAILKMLIAEGLDLQAKTIEDINGLDRLKQAYKMIDMQEQHMKEHDHGGHGCGHHHEPVDFDEYRGKLKAIQEILIDAGVKPSKAEFVKPPVPIESIPENISQGYLQDQTLRTVEERFGGALWEKQLEVFYTGKKPKVGYAIQVNLNFLQPIGKLTFTWLRGIISSVQPNRITATLSLSTNVDHKDLLHAQFGKHDWEATLVWYPYNKFPWVLVKLVPLQNDACSYENMVKLALKREETEGRKVQKIKQEDNVCWILKGDKPHSHDDEEEHEHKVAVAIDLTQAGVKITFEDGTSTLSKDNPVAYFQHVVGRAVQLKKAGVDTLSVSIEGKPFDLAQFM